VVAVEHRAGLVAGHLHGHAFGNASVYQIPNGRAPEVVAQPLARLRAAAGTLPRLAKILNPLHPVPAPGVREEMRDDPPELPLEGQRRVLAALGLAAEPPPGHVVGAA
jgi:hypothetical protein